MDSYSTIEAIDTNVILRLILNDNERDRERVVEHFLSTSASFMVDDYCLGEIEHVMKGKNFSRKEIVEELSALLMNPIFVWNKELFRKVFRLYSERPSLSFNDCYLVFKAEEAGAVPLWTLDRKLANQAEGARLI